MSSKKSKKITRRIISQSDFKKVSPSQLEDLGYSRKAERFYDLKKLAPISKRASDGTISKREYAKLYFGQKSNEAKAKAIKAGERPILPNAPLKARQAKIQAASTKREAKGTHRKNRPFKIRALADGKNRYDYKINPIEFLAVIENIPEKEFALIASLTKIFDQHPKNNQTLWRFVLSGFSEDGKKMHISTPLSFNKSTSALDAIELLRDELLKLIYKYAILIDKNIEVVLRIYAI